LNVLKLLPSVMYSFSVTHELCLKGMAVRLLQVLVAVNSISVRIMEHVNQQM